MNSDSSHFSSRRKESNVHVARKSNVHAAHEAYGRVKQTREEIIKVLVKHSMIYTELVWITPAGARHYGTRCMNALPDKSQGHIKHLACPGLTVEDIAVKIEEPAFVVQNTLDWLVEHNIIEANTRGFWHWRKTYYRPRPKASQK